MRIALVTESFVPHTDSVADTSRAVVDELIRAGHEVLVIAPGPGQASYRGARVIRARRLVPASAMTTAINEFGPDVVHVMSPRMLGALALRAAARLVLPTVVVNQHALDGAAAQWWTTRVHPRSARTLVTCSDAEKRLTAIGVGAHVWRPGVDLDDFTPTLRDEKLHQRWSKDGSRVVVGHVGDLQKEKVVKRLTAIAQLPGARLVVLADGADDGAGAAALREAGAKVLDNVTGLELARGIATFDVLVQPRKKEMCVPGVRRALASGVPAVAFDAGGAADVVRHENNGLLAHKGDLVASVDRLVKDPTLRAALAGNARASVEQRTWSDAVTELVERHYSPVLAKSASRVG